jgi:uncharacterized OB-fold protein
MSQTSPGTPRVQPNLDTAWWWKALAQDELLVPACRACSRRFFPPQAFCPNCGSKDWHGAASNGRGKVYSWIVTHRAFAPELADEVPYAIVAVDLDDGGRLIGRYFGEFSELRDALPVRAKIYRKDADTLLGFEPAARP